MSKLIRASRRKMYKEPLRIARSVMCVAVCVWAICQMACSFTPLEESRTVPSSNHSVEACGFSESNPSSKPTRPASTQHTDWETRYSALACGPGSAQFPALRSFSVSPEPYARYVGQKQCSPSAKPGMKAFRDLILKTYPCTGDYGISRNCSRGGQSEHKEGRAWDWKLNYPHPAADAVIQWLLKTRDGVPHAYVRRLGLMYMIWNRKIWKAYQASKGWQKYTGASPHTDHVHFSFSHAGGAGSTSFWKGEVQAPSGLHAKLVEKTVKQAVKSVDGRSFILCPGQQFSIQFKINNSGTREWSDTQQNVPGKAVRLGFKGGETLGLPKRLSVNTTGSPTVPSGQSVTFTLSATAPTQPGTYTTRWQMVSELIEWFGPVVEVTVQVTAQPPQLDTQCTVQGQSGGCGQGTMKCTQRGLMCIGARSSEEKCDNQDNDCNGKIDDALFRSCYTGPASTQNVGACRTGREICTAGQWGTCEGQTLPATKEVCGNTLDDNCNGQVDEGCGDVGCSDKDGDGYGVGKGCVGERDCDDTLRSVYPGAPEICGNGRDDDCRGGDRPCQNTTNENTGGSQCANPPCGVIKIDPSNPSNPNVRVRGSGCVCSTHRDPSPFSTSGWIWVCIVFGFCTLRRSSRA